MKYLIPLLLVFPILASEAPAADTVENRQEISKATAYEPTDKDLPVAAKKSIEDFGKAEAAAKTAYDKVMHEAGNKLLKELNDSKVSATKNGNLEGALAVKARIDELKLDLVLAGHAPKKEMVEKGKGAKSGLKIISVVYGANDKFIDATDFVRSKVKNGVLKFTHDENFTNGPNGLADPAPWVTKTFVITYKIHGIQKVESFPKHSIVILGGR
jgi:hypothetical protein